MGAGDAPADELRASLRALPSVERLAAALDGPHAEAVAAARAAIEERRTALTAGDRGDAGDVVDLARHKLAAAQAPSLRRVINATGVIVHTNLGRAPLADAAREALARAAGGYGNLELDLASGGRGSRHVHVEGLLRELTGAQAALAVNNGAGAALLAVAALAGGRAVVVSRGQLVEIGGGFRVPEVIAQSGARMVEVGTTNRTRRSDYERALAALEPGERGAVLRVHASNFRTVGFTEEVAIEELCGLGLPVIDDVGSGRLDEDLAVLADEPSVRRSVAAGAALVCFSGDKLLGGPQAGLLVGREHAVAAARAHPLARALRIDRLSLAALAATLLVYRDPVRARREIPVLAMLDSSQEQLAARAEGLRAGLASAGVAAQVQAGVARAGGGALPLAELEGPVVAVDAERVGADELARRLRAGEPPVVARIERGRVVLDPRTMTGDDAEGARAAVVAALR